MQGELRFEPAYASAIQSAIVDPIAEFTNPQPWAAFVRIDHELAALMLHGPNRTTRQSALERYIDDMKGNDWCFTGQPIIFDPAGNCRDGSHRLRAVIETKTTHLFLCVFNIPENAQKYMDLVARRTAADTLSIIHVRNARVVASSLNHVAQYMMYYNKGVGITSTEFSLRPNQALAFYLKFPVIADSVAYAHESKLINPSWLGALHFLFSQADPEKARPFCEAAYKGIDAAAGTPESLLHQTLLKRFKLKKEGEIKTRSILERNYWMAASIKAWNASRSGRVVRSLGWPSNDREAFPRISGLTLDFSLPTVDDDADEEPPVAEPKECLNC